MTPPRETLLVPEPGQLTLLPAEPAPLRPRQQAVLDALTRAGHDGLHADEAGAIAHALKEGRWAHSPDDRCDYCLRDGRQILERLRDLGHVRYRAGKLKVWQAVNLPNDLADETSLLPGMSAEIPY